jgi:hypothetical protein
VDARYVDAGSYFVFSDNKHSGFSVFVDDIVPDASFASLPIRKLLDFVPGPHGSLGYFPGCCTVFDLYFENKESNSAQCCSAECFHPRSWSSFNPI